MEEELLKPSPLRGGEPEPPKPGSGAWKGVLAALLLVLAGLGAIYVYSRREPPAPPPSPTPTPAPLPSATPDPAMRRKAEAALDELMEVMRPVRAARPEWWGGEAWERALEASDAGDRALAGGEFEEAAERYRAALEPARALRRRLPDLPTDLFPGAEAAYAAGDRETAVGLLEAILAVDSEHPGAMALRPRAETADRSFAILERATSLAGKEEYGPAWAELGRLENLDVEFPGASELRERVAEILAEAEFEEWISKAILAVEARNPDEARTLLARAAAARPEHPAVAGLERQIRDLEIQRRVLELRERALTHEEQGEWREAHELWLRISSMDPHTPWVADGLERTLNWRLIDQRLDEAEANPASVRTGKWVREVFAEREDWPEGLDRRARAVVETWNLHQTPVPVVIESDAETTVAVERVGRWEPFVTKRIELRPGRYVAKGTRLGHRDVRIPFEVKPGAEKVELRVVATEGI